MKKILLSTVAFLGMAAAASAADLPRRSAPVVYAPVIPAFTWTGFYAGFNAGYAFNTNDRDTSILIPTGTVAGSLATTGTLSLSDRDRDGFAGGGQIGYNYQFTPGSGFVIGVEADIQYVDFGGRRGGGFDFTPGVRGAAFATGTIGTLAIEDTRSSLDYFGTVRGRLGYAFDRTLVYATGGFAYGGGDERNNPFFTRDNTRTGYTVGGGVEFALAQDSFLNFFGSNAVTFKIEGLYVNLDSDRRDTVGLAFQPATNTLFIDRRDSEEFAVVRAGVNYKFGTY